MNTGLENTNKIKTDENNEIELDESNKPVFVDQIKMETTTDEHRNLWLCIRLVLEEGLVPEPEIDACISLMEKLAIQEKDSRKPYFITLPINYFVGLWHCVNTCRKFDLFKDDKKVDKIVDGLALKLAGYLDYHHSVKSFEQTLEVASPLDILNEPPKLGIATT